MIKQMTASTDPTKKEVKFEDETSITIWKYNLNVSKINPVEVEIKYKKSYVHPKSKKKTIGELAAESKKLETQAKKQKKLKGM
jgi:hypothetical protein